MTSGSSDPNDPDPPSPATSVYLWGPDRPRLNGTARRLAARLDPRFHWVEASGPDAEPTNVTAPAELSVVCDPRDLVPAPAVPAEMLWTQLRPRGQRRAVEELRDFLRIPEPIQAAVASLLGPAGRAPRLLVLANVDRIAAFDHERPKFVGDFIEFLNSHAISLLVTSTGRPLLERIDFEYSLTTTDSLPEGFRAGGAVCQWGNCLDCLARCFPASELVCLARLTNGPLSTSGRGSSLAGFASH